MSSGYDELTLTRELAAFPHQEDVTELYVFWKLKAVYSKALLLEMCQTFTLSYVAISDRLGPVTASLEELDKQVEAPPLTHETTCTEL